VSACDRRRFLALAARAGAAAACAPLVLTAACGDGGAAPGPLRLALADLPDGGRLRVEVMGAPVELVRHGEQVAARSLLCTHQGCEVAWHEAEGAYVCPCHDGRFDADGRPVYGPPRLPLRAVPVARDGLEVVIGA